MITHQTKNVSKDTLALPTLTDLNLYQQIRLSAVEGKKPAFRTWKSRMKHKNMSTDPVAYIMFGYKVPELWQL